MARINTSLALAAYSAFREKSLARESQRRRQGYGVEDPALAPLICPLGCPEFPEVQPCPAHCAALRCPALRPGQAKLPWLTKLVRSLRAHQPLHPAPLSPARTLLLITITFPHAEQLLKLEHCAHALRGEPGVLWLVAEDAASPSPRVAETLRRSGIRHTHLAHGPTRARGNAQRDAALRHVREHNLSGIVYNMDDDNAYAPRVWNELRALGAGRVGALAVRRAVYPPPRCDGHFLPLRRVERRKLRIDRPLYDNRTGRFTRFEAGWCRRGSWMSRKLGPRKFCVDMGGFAFDSSLLRSRVPSGPIWDFSGHGGESELIEKLLGPAAGPDALQVRRYRGLHSTRLSVLGK